MRHPSYLFSPNYAARGPVRAEPAPRCVSPTTDVPHDHNPRVPPNPGAKSAGRPSYPQPRRFEIISFMISLVPPPMVMRRESRKLRAMGNSSA